MRARTGISIDGNTRSGRCASVRAEATASRRRVAVLSTGSASAPNASMAIKASTRSGAAAASRLATPPPSEWPSTLKRSQPRSSATCSKIPIALLSVYSAAVGNHALWP
ncbi:hypothetical protein CFBP2533_42940 [Xanthomonas hortorum pv. pelargonii]|uniref:Uncharacterized protein n=1 Tax=Xanthomonas hortorum pv. pelargonii TaxID=453602 RepID=A0A6V7F5D8_9XANT|nr:hypothetical protein CFBP2533_42940 [Xanthomonas hortorum pv. pelargonii]CAD0358709.1 hypothetical protein CFBP2533_42940 [Xanthomonas hortorum pv. pelargonii]